ncbi:metal-dependent hydrolase [Salinigranum halophilum]|uniref:metal-dependent hydrolase n=1 Tax=Salinigranum halophilum TaxID=2565931 RepID=UPI00115CB236|nr:metal-dependent hydrolase [Salinigranum halophilum]
MERRGHYGMTLLLGAVAVLLLSVPAGVLSTLVMLLFTTLPDKDQVVSVLRHRGVTHTVGFALLVAFTVPSTVAYPIHVLQELVIQFGVLHEVLINPHHVWQLLCISIFVGLTGHLGADMLTKGGGYRVRPFWPISKQTYAAGLCTSDDERWNTGLLMGGATAFSASVVHELYDVLFPGIVAI